MDFLGLALSLALGVDSQGFTGNYEFNASPTFAIEAPIGNLGMTATALPGMVLYDPRKGDPTQNDHLAAHELAHGEQQRALGPAYWAAYLASAGQPFEPYNLWGYGMGVPAEQAGVNDSRDMSQDLTKMWMPPPDMPEEFPIFQLARKDGTTNFSFMPGYPGVSIQVGGPSGSR